MASKVVLDAAGLRDVAPRIAGEILERNPDLARLRIIGVRSRGIHLATRLAEEIRGIRGTAPPIGVVDITLYRDDLRRSNEWPAVKTSDIPFDVDEKDIILVDDVIYTGRTARAAMEVIMDYGRPASIQLVALVDRGRRELPIQPDYVGVVVETSANQSVEVRLMEMDKTDEVVLTGG